MSRWLVARVLVVSAGVLAMTGGVEWAASSARVDADQWTRLADQTRAGDAAAEEQAGAGSQYVRAHFLAWYALRVEHLGDRGVVPVTRPPAAPVPCRPAGRRAGKAP
ncbi:hypothetical protein [Actinophytocola oryzae]|uniref:Uncharacterized protein n=1 Tax=Actinophytocola oryzae TaxID=502181 RepID=A0A4V3FUR0_9PSEU|nr:hypothetical protein [Actinophytocola oryzae]TDV56201.1 hypothetical protein CLV71_102267 [Actinophytocola oryzae]